MVTHVCKNQYTGPLATDDQIKAEKLALRIIERPEVKAVRPQLVALLKRDTAAALSDGLAEIDRALDLWTMTLVMWELNADTARPMILWHVDNSSHGWFGHQFPGMGAAGDNPDHIYRGGFLDGHSTYEITGKMPANGPAQLSFEIFRGSPGQTQITEQTSSTPDLGNQVSLIMSDYMTFADDGTFTVTVGPQVSDPGPNYLTLEPGVMTLAVRDVLSDWHQEPATVEIKRLSGPPAGEPLSEQLVAERVAVNLPGFVGFWSSFKTNWLGGIPVNGIVGPSPRAGGWGYLVGGRFNLADDEAIVVTIEDAGARYIGFMVDDPWMIIPVDAREHTVSLNNAQVQRNPDNSITYVLATTDPGVANWIDTAGLHQGLFIIRWQGVPPGADPEQMVKQYRYLKLDELSSVIADTVPRVTEEERKEQVGKRARDYDLRLGNLLKPN